MKRLLIVILSVITLLSIAVTDCIAQEPTLPDRLTWFTFAAPSSEYQMSVGIIDFINQNMDINMTLRPYPVPPQGWASLHSGQADIGFITNSGAYHLARGMTSEVETRGTKVASPEIRMLIGGENRWWAMVTRPDSGITKLADLKGHTIQYEIPGLSIMKAIGEDMLNSVGLSPDDVKLGKFGSRGEYVSAYKNGKLDSMLSGMGGADIMELKSTQGLVLLPVTPAQFETFRPLLKDVALISWEVPAGWVGGVDKPTWMVGMPKIIAVTDEFSDEAAYQIVKLLVNRGRELDNLGPMFKEIGNKKFILPPNLVVPVHPGAKKYYEEAGFWTPEYEMQHQKLLKELSNVTPG